MASATARSSNYGRVTTLAVGPVERILYHFMPGSTVLSIGGLGCNMACGYCQNYTISQSDKAESILMRPEDVVLRAVRERAAAVAFTYSEPLVWQDYVRDVFQLSKEAGLMTILKTNGMCPPEEYLRLMEVTDAANIDLKGNQGVYKDVCGVDLPGDMGGWDIVRNIRATKETGRHIEVSVMAIPGYRDSVYDAMDAINSAVGLSVPVHLLRFIPDFKMKGVVPYTRGEMASFRDMYEWAFKYFYVDYCGIDAVTKCPRCRRETARRVGTKLESFSYICQCGKEQDFVV